jgi:hypothetical protein
MAHHAILTQTKTAIALKNNENLSELKQSAIDSDRWSIFAMCMWCNIIAGLMFHVIFCFLVQVGGRVNKVSTMRKSDLATKVSICFV